MDLLCYYQNKKLSGINIKHIESLTLSVSDNSIKLLVYINGKGFRSIPIDCLNPINTSWFHPFIQECRSLCKQHNLPLPLWMKPSTC